MGRNISKESKEFIQFCAVSKVSNEEKSKLENYRYRINNVQGSFPNYNQLKAQLCKIREGSRALGNINPTYNYKNIEGEWKSYSCDNFVITKYISSTEIYIEFVTYPYKIRVKTGDIRTGMVRNPYYPTVAGVACSGNPPKGSITFKGKTTASYNKWVTMVNRCYEPDNDSYIRYGGKGVYVVEEWLNYEKFLLWFNKQPNKDKSEYHIDKDIISEKGIGHYSPETCELVPPYINQLIKLNKGNRNGNIIGTTQEGEFYKSQFMSCGGVLGTYKTVEEAFQVYKEAREAHVKVIAYASYKKGEISARLLCTLLDWEVNIDD